ncbi:MAG: hypothetical protein M0D55_17990 [Elusimicrobiota bacterium]|nr:MAG: hypothetical protein M0D55_17990 [Elusimicrobiota bacterium]
MSKKLSTPMVVLGLSFALWISRPFEPAPELPAGAVVAGGLVAGEGRALEHFRREDPELFAELEKLDPAERRARFGRWFAWFQRGPGYRSGQKADARLRIRAALGLPVVATAAEQAYEWPAGTVLDGGLVAGEAEALAYVKEHEPALSRRLQALGAGERRARFKDKFAWFQRAGNYRKRQKAESIRQMTDELALVELERAARAAGPVKRAALAAEARGRIESLYDSNTGLLEWRLAGLDQELSALARRPVVWLFQPGELLSVRRELRAAQKSLAARRAAREAEVARAAGALLKG